MQYEQCPICKNMAEPETYDAIKNRRFYNCKNCGKFYLMDMLWKDIDIYEKEKGKFYKVSSWITEQNTQFGTTPEIDKDKFEEILSMQDKKIREKFDLLMRYISKGVSKEFDINNMKATCWIQGNSELGVILTKIIERNYVKGVSVKKSIAGTYTISMNNAELTFDGKAYVEELNEVNTHSKQVFTAFYFSDEIKEVFDNEVKQAIEECSLEYTRVSSSTTPHDTTINDEIIAKIKSSRLVIADFTGQRNSVYFEAGYAMGMGLPVIWTCKKDEANDLAFDTRQYPHILWENAEDLKMQLVNRIRAII
jgi:nucleoside 2-deoxyribosyltransferase/transcription elongation factor Elf1